MIYNRIVIKNESELGYIYNKNNISDGMYRLLKKQNEYPIYIFLDNNEYCGYCYVDCCTKDCSVSTIRICRYHNYVDTNYFRKEKFKILLDGL